MWLRVLPLTQPASPPPRPRLHPRPHPHPPGRRARGGEGRAAQRAAGAAQGGAAQPVRAGVLGAQGQRTRQTRRWAGCPPAGWGPGGRWGGRHGSAEVHGDHARPARCCQPSLALHHHPRSPCRLPTRLPPQVYELLADESHAVRHAVAELVAAMLEEQGRAVLEVRAREGPLLAADAGLGWFGSIEGRAAAVEGRRS